MKPNQPLPSSTDSHSADASQRGPSPRMGLPARQGRRSRSNPLALLVILLVYMIITLAGNWQGWAARLVWAALVSLVPLVSMSGLRGEKPRLLRILGVLGAIQVIALWVYCFLPVTSTSIAESIASTVFYSYLTALLVAYLARSRSVSANTIFAAATVFLLLGIAWSQVHHLIELAQPGSYTAGMNATDYLYFSFTTLTTTGFGDIQAKSSLARLATVWEEIMGTLYVAILIGRIVGITVSYAAEQKGSGAAGERPAEPVSSDATAAAVGKEERDGIDSPPGSSAGGDRSPG